MRGISVAVLLALLGINLAGVKWIIRLQLLLLLLLAVSTLDFVVGSFTHLDPGKPLGVQSQTLGGSALLPRCCRSEYAERPPVAFACSERVLCLEQVRVCPAAASLHIDIFPCALLFLICFLLEKKKISIRERIK